MRTIRLAGSLVGGVSGVALVALGALQLGPGLLIVVGVALAGLVGGLCAAKWLDRWWYGRQLEAGARAGFFACALAACGALVSLLAYSPKDATTLALRSQIGPLSMAPLIQGLSFVGWLGLDILAVAAAAVVGIVLAALSAQIAGWTKSGKALRIVEQARQAAQALARDEETSPSRDASPAQGIPAGTLLNRLPGEAFAVPATPALGLATPRSTYGPMPEPQPAPTPQMPFVPPRRATAGPATPPPALRERPAEIPLDAHALDASSMPVGSPAPAPAPAPVSAPAPAPLAAGTGRRVRTSSSARPANKQLTQAMKEALAAWASDNGESMGVQPAAETRAPLPSTYLNSAPPAPKRNRKKNATRDWIC